MRNSFLSLGKTHTMLYTECTPNLLKWTQMYRFDLATKMKNIYLWIFKKIQSCFGYKWYQMESNKFVGVALQMPCTGHNWNRLKASSVSYAYSLNKRPSKPQILLEALG